MVSFNFRLHQPAILKKFTVFDIGTSSEYFEAMEPENESLLASGKALLEMIENYGLCFGLTITGTALDHLERSSPEMLELIRKMLDTGNAELMATTYYNTFAHVFSQKEFTEQLRMHGEKVRSIFGAAPRTLLHDSPVEGYKVLAHSVVQMESFKPSPKVATMDFSSVGQKSELFSNLVSKLKKEHDFIKPSEVIEQHEFSKGTVFRNQLQSSAAQQLFQLEDHVYATNDISLIEKWRALQDASHMEHMCTECIENNPYDTP